jgi:hypothetical protein
MNKEVLLQKIKHEVARERDYKDWASMMKWYIDKNVLFMLTVAYEKVTERFAIAMCEEQKKQCHAAASIQSLPHTIFKAILETKNVAE